MRAGHRPAIRQGGGDAGATRNCADTGAFDNRHPFRAQLLHHHGGQFGVFPAKRASGFDHCHRAAQTAMRLCHLKPDRPAPQDQQMRRLLAQGKDRFIGQIGHIRQAGDRRHDRPRARGNHKAARGNAVPARLHLGGRGETGPVADHGDAQTFETLLAVHGGNGGNGAGDMILDRAEIHLRRGGGYAQRRPCRHRMRRLGGGEQRLGRNAAVVEAIAPHLGTFDQHDTGTHLHRTCGHRQAAGPRADYADVGMNAGHVTSPSAGLP